MLCYANNSVIKWVSRLCYVTMILASQILASTNYVWVFSYANNSRPFLLPMSLIKSADSLCLVSLLCDNDFSFLLQGIIMYSVKGGSWEFSLNQLFNQLCPKGIPRILNRYFWFLFFVFFLIFLFLGPQRISVCSGGLLLKLNSWCLQNMFILFSPHRCLIVLHGSPLSLLFP